MTAEEYYQSRNGGKDSQTSDRDNENYSPRAWVQMMQDYGDLAAKSWELAHEILSAHYRRSAELNVKEMNENARLKRQVDHLRSWIERADIEGWSGEELRKNMQHSIIREAQP